MGVKQLTDHNINLDESEAEVERLEKILVQKLAEFKKILPQDNENWQSVSEAIAEDEAIVEMVRVREFKVSNQ